MVQVRTWLTVPVRPLVTVVATAIVSLVMLAAVAVHDPAGPGVGAVVTGASQAGLPAAGDGDGAGTDDTPWD